MSVFTSASQQSSEKMADGGSASKRPRPVSGAAEEAGAEVHVMPTYVAISRQQRLYVAQLEKQLSEEKERSAYWSRMYRNLDIRASQAELAEALPDGRRQSSPHRGATGRGRSGLG